MAEYPVLLEAATDECHQISTKQGGTEVGHSSMADIPIKDLSCSRRQFRVVLESGRYFLEGLSQTHATLLNGSRISVPAILSHGDRIQAGTSEFQFLEHEGRPPGVREAGTATRSSDQAATTAEPQAPAPRGSSLSARDLATLVRPSTREDRAQAEEMKGSFRLGKESYIGRDEERADLHLPSPQVSRLHARITRSGAEYKLTDLNSTNGVFLNGKRVLAPVQLTSGDKLAVGPYSLVFAKDSLEFSSCEGNLCLVAENLAHRVKNRSTGDELVILEDVSLVIEPNEFVVLLGPSGSGKSTLMNAISARVPATNGTVRLNGEDLYENFDALKANLALVPQRDVVHSQLTASRALYYTASLRLPADTSEEEIHRRVDDILVMLGLEDKRDTLIGSLSGGQVKRVSLGNEIIAQPSLLFLDEVTSGLDEQTDREMMSCFRRVADSGKTVVCVTHSLANVDRYCDLILVMAPGGKLAFYGPPRDALGFFAVPRLGDIYDKMGERSPDEWKRLYRDSQLCQEFVDRRIPSREQRSAGRTPPPTFSLRDLGYGTLRQLLVLVPRYLRILLRDRASLLFALAQPVLIGILLYVLFGNLSGATQTVQLLFFVSTSCMWFGCSNAAKELVKERAIYRRERDVNLLLSSYYLSKILVLGALGCVQVLILLGIVGTTCHMEGSWSWQFIILNCAAMNGTVLGLLLSAVSSSSDLAATLVPIVLIPQIVLAGMMASLEGLAKLLAVVFIGNYWALHGLKATLPDEMKRAIGDVGSVWGALAMLTLFVAVGVSLALWMLRRSDLRSGGRHG